MGGSMKQVTARLFIAGAFILLPAARAAHDGSLDREAMPTPGQVAAIAVDYPLPGSIFPPEILAPTFLWRDPAEATVRWWRVDVGFADHTPPIQVKAKGERMKVGTIDPRCVSDTNELPKLTPEQAAAHTWAPDAETWAAIKKHSVKKPATVTITGYSDDALKAPVSRGSVTLSTSKDPVGAPIFYRDVPLMPSETLKGVIKPLAPQAMKLITWRLKYIDEPGSRKLIEGFPTCANCHSFSRDGKTLALDVDGPQNDKGLYAMVSVKPDTVISKDDIIKWSTFKGPLGGKLRVAFGSQVSPDGKYVVTMINDPRVTGPNDTNDQYGKYYVVNFKDYRFLQVFYPTRGILAWYSKATGMLQPLPGADDPKMVQTDGVWSPDQKFIVFARATARDPFPPGVPMAERANDPQETQIQYDLYRVPFNKGKGGKAVEIQGASGDGMSNNFPKVSPDGKWIVYVRCKNAQLMRPDSQLYIVPSKGGTPRRMLCNQPVMNSWHTFSPNGRWLAFSSKGRSPYTQLYLTHIDKHGQDSPAILVEGTTAANRAVNIPEFVNIPRDGLLKIESPATEYYRLFDLALDLTREDKFDAATAEWEKAMALGPDESKVHYNLGLSLARLRRYDEAIAQFQKALELDPKDADSHTNLGVTLVKTGKPQEAIPQFRKALELKPGDAQAYSNLGGLMADTGQLDGAIEEFRKALEIDPKNADAENNLAVTLSRANRPEEAIPHFEKALAADPGSRDYRYNLARVLMSQGKFPEAIPHLEKLSSAPDPSLLATLASAYAKVGRYSDALPTAKRALDLAERQGNRQLAAGLEHMIASYESRTPGGSDPARYK
jgi:Flp pilus assembly protein TadD